MRRPPVATLLLLLALLVRGLRMSARILRMLLGLAGIFLALGMVILAVRVGGRAMRLRCGFCDVPPPCCDLLSCCFLIVSRRMSATPQLASIVAAPSVHGVFVVCC